MTDRPVACRIVVEAPEVDPGDGSAIPREHPAMDVHRAAVLADLQATQPWAWRH